MIIMVEIGAKEAKMISGYQYGSLHQQARKRSKSIAPQYSKPEENMKAEHHYERDGNEDD